MKEHECCEESFVFYDEREKRWALDVDDSLYPIKYCPWCGIKLEE